MDNFLKDYLFVHVAAKDSTHLYHVCTHTHTHTHTHTCIHVILPRTYALVRVQRLEDNYKKLSPSHQQMLSQFPAHIANARRAVETNYEFVKKIVSSAVGMFENSAVSHFVSLWKNVRVYYSVQHVNKGESIKYKSTEYKQSSWKGS